jgi:hypothetical protein
MRQLWAVVPEAAPAQVSAARLIGGMFKRKFLRQARMGKAAVAKVIGRWREYLRARFARKQPRGPNRRSPLAGDAFEAGCRPLDMLWAVISGAGICKSRGIARERAPTDGTAR